jgi:hypothetical protein
METLEKYAGESRIYEMDFSQKAEIINGDSLHTVSSVSSSISGLTFGTPSISGTKVVCAISGGTSYTNYVVTFVAVTLGGAMLVGEGGLLIYP